MNKLFNKIIVKISNSKLYVLTALMSLFIISLLYILNDVTPFGTKSLLCVDFYHQYGPMLGELYDRLHHGSNLIYSFNMGLGMPFYRNFLNYMSSPFNIIIMFFSRYDLVTSYSYIIGLKAVFASLTFVYFISHKFNTKELYLIPLGILYAFSAYYSAYYWNIMWLDGIVFLPLITLGIERLINHGRWKFYTIILSIMLISNYFIGYMICIFSVVYFLIYSLYKTNKQNGIKKEFITFIKRGLLFAFASILSGMLAAIALIPMYYAMKSISATGGAWPKTQYYLFTLEDFLKYHLTGVTTTTFASDPINAPNISTGILTVSLLLTFIFNKKIPFKTKICYGLLLAFFICAFFNIPLDFILHAFHVPNDLPYRYSFLYVFSFMIIASYSAYYIKEMYYIKTIIIYTFIMLLLLTITGSKWTGINNNMIFINMILLTLYFVFYSGAHFIKQLKGIFYIALGCTACIDAVVSINYNWDITQVLETFYLDYYNTEELLDYVKKFDTSEFYRIENTQMMTLNDPSWYNYRGMTTFSSMAYESMAELQNNLGLPGNGINSYYYVQTTPVYDLMFNMKYSIGISNDKNRYTPIKTIAETANVFNYSNSLGYGVNDDIENWNYQNPDPLKVQNDYIEKATGVKDVFEEMIPEKVIELYNQDGEYIVEYDYNNPNDNMYFFTKSYAVDFFVIGNCLYYKNDTYSYYKDMVPEINVGLTDNYKEEKIINILSQDSTVKIYVGYSNYQTNAFNMYNINNDNFMNAYNILRSSKLDIYDFKETNIKANLSIDKDMTIYTSIPYDDGWHVYIDGDEVEKEKLAESLLMFKAKQGTHKIEFKFEPKGFKIGLALTLTSILILLFDTILVNKILVLFKKKTIKKT